jgi:NAD(P)-dependent dehydrogenase (short-subunit alcohol dehydrogenase family)
MDLTRKVAVVTGAGSGIGRALTIELAHRGSTVVACDIEVDAARQTVERIAAVAGTRHKAFAVDVADENSVNALAKSVQGEFGEVDILVNNAGVLGRMAPLDQLSTQELEWVLGVDLWGPIHGTRAFLPLLRERREAALVNVCSFAGLMGSLGNAAYFASKFGVRGFSEAVRAELKPTGVKVTIVFPGVVKTNLGASGYGFSAEEKREAVRRYNSQPGVSPERAARQIARGIERGRSRVLVGADAWVIDKLVRAFPGNMDRVMHAFTARAVNRLQPDGRQVFR